MKMRNINKNTHGIGNKGNRESERQTDIKRERKREVKFYKYDDNMIRRPCFYMQQNKRSRQRHTLLWVEML